jgi:hypothetical protein
MAARKVEDPKEVVSFRVRRSVRLRWEIYGGNWRETIAAWMTANAPKTLAEELAELEAARARGAVAEPESDEF